MDEQSRRHLLLEAYDFKLEPRTAFQATASAQLMARASAYAGAYVLWDPLDDADGFLLVGDDPELLRAAWHEHYPEL